MDEDIAGVVEVILWDHVLGNDGDSYVIAEFFVKALARKGYKIVKVDDTQPATVG